MTLQDYLTRDDLPGGRACVPAIEWLDETEPASVADAVATFPSGEWLLWLAERVGVPIEVQAAAVRPAVMRAARVYAADACEAAGLAEQAAALRALPDDAPFGTVQEVADAAGAAADAACYAARAARWAADAAAAAAADDDAAVSAALRAARAARSAGFAPSENALCADDVRAAIPDLAERVERAMEAA